MLELPTPKTIIVDVVPTGRVRLLVIWFGTDAARKWVHDAMRPLGKFIQFGTREYAFFVDNRYSLEETAAYLRSGAEDMPGE